MTVGDRLKRSAKRVQILKQMIIRSLFISIFVLIVFCIILFTRIHSLQKQLSRVTDQLEAVTQWMSQQEEISIESIVTEGNGSILNNQAAFPDNDGMVDVLTGDIISEDIPPDGSQEYLHKVYLTFDDGPSIYTQEILDILDQYDVKATFFVLGKEDENSIKAIQDIVDRGHTLGMHSYSHEYRQIYESVTAFAEDFYKLRDYMQGITEVKSICYRFPGGSSNTISRIDMQEFADFLDKENIKYFDWNISSGDGASKILSAKIIAKNCTQGIEDRETSIILLHDSAQKRTTVDALPMIIENILAMEDTVLLPITEDTQPVQHIYKKTSK